MKDQKQDYQQYNFHQIWKYEKPIPVICLHDPMPAIENIAADEQGS